MSSRSSSPKSRKPSAEVDVAPVVVPEPTVYCDNHPETKAVFRTDGTAFQVLNLCGPCVPKTWR